MKIHLRQIQADGLHLEGEEEFPIPELAAEGVACTAPLRYSLDLGISEGSMWVTGHLAQPVELKCVRCLEPFPFDIEVPAFSIHHELTGPELIDPHDGRTTGPVAIPGPWCESGETPGRVSVRSVASL